MPDPSNPYSSLQTDFDRGIAVALDPANTVALQQGGKATTTLSSHWLHQRCPVCAHTFRINDEVAISAEGSVRHNSALLPCAQEKTQTNPTSAETAAFFTGLDEAWPPPPDMPVRRLEAGSELLSPPFAGFQRHTCAVCGHTLRLHDLVVICPCSPTTPLCKTAIHRDPLHNLHCLEAWNPGANQQRYCPVTSRKLND